jgi:hypothetical protein
LPALGQHPGLDGLSSGRHLTEGQQAMAIAMIYPEPKKTGRGKKSSVTEDIGSGRLSMARTILKFVPKLAKKVITAEESLDEAYEKAQKRKKGGRGNKSKLSLSFSPMYLSRARGGLSSGAGNAIPHEANQ